jgi:hypothetical protein
VFRGGRGGGNVAVGDDNDILGEGEDAFGRYMCYGAVGFFYFTVTILPARVNGNLGNFPLNTARLGQNLRAYYSNPAARSFSRSGAPLTGTTLLALRQ